MLLVVVVAFAALRPGSGPPEGEGSPATVVPPRAALYLEADLRPTGDQGVAVRQVLQRLLRTNRPAVPLRDLLDQALARSGTGLVYTRDVEPWLGRRAGLFVTRFSRLPTRSEGALVLSTSNADRARRAVALVRPARSARRTYRGVSYEAGGGGPASAVVSDFLVVGAEPAVRAAIDAWRGSALADTDQYRRELPLQPYLALGYLNWTRLLDALPPGTFPADLQRDARLRLARVNAKPLVPTLSASDGRLALDIGPIPPPPGPPVPIGGGLGGSSLLPTRQLPRLPADALAALDLPELGQQLYATVSPGLNPGVPNDEIRPLLRGLARRTGLDLGRDLLPWLGGVAVFAQGTSRAQLGGAVVMESLEPARSRRAADRLEGSLRGRPGFDTGPSELAGVGQGFSFRAEALPGQRFHVFARGNRVVLAYGRRAAMTALDAPRKLGDLPAYEAGAKGLGQGLLPSAWLSAPAALSFADSTALGRAPAYVLLRRYLDRLSFVIFGSKRSFRRFLAGVR